LTYAETTVAGDLRAEIKTLSLPKGSGAKLRGRPPAPKARL